MSQIPQKQYIASIRGTTADRPQFHETNASLSVQPIGRENFPKTLDHPQTKYI